MTIRQGGSSKLKWKVKNATWATLEGGGYIGAVRMQGSMRVSPASTTTYVLSAGDGSRTVTTSATVTVSGTTPAPTPPPTTSRATATLTASSGSIASGQSSTLTWTTSNATSATLGGSSVALNGSRIVSPTATTTYTLVATNAAGSATAAAVVTVTGSPSPAPAYTYTAHIAPLMAAQCNVCHGSGVTHAGVNTTTHSNLTRLGNNLPSAMSGNMNTYVLPFNGMTKAQVIAMVREWIRLGSPQ